jgi:ATP sulfurylase
MKEKFNKDMENLRKRFKQKSWKLISLNQTKNPVESRSNRIEYMEGRVSGLKDK